MSVDLERLPTSLSGAGTFADRVFERLEYAIVTGDIPLGSRLGEEALAGRFGVSRGPLREALQRLQGRGLVVRLAHAGVRVVTLTQADLVELYHIREMLEGLACRLAAERMTQDELAELDATIEQDLNTESMRRDSSYTVVYGRSDFHYRIAEGSHSGRLAHLLCGDLYSLIRLCRFKTSNLPGRPLRALRDHRRIAEAIRDRDGDMAEMLMRRHIRAARQEIEAPAFAADGIRPTASGEPVPDAPTRKPRTAMAAAGEDTNLTADDRDDPARPRNEHEGDMSR